MGFNGEYVVGFIGSDGSLGRTISGDYSVALKAMEVLFDETEDLIAPPSTYWDDHCSYSSDTGTYFFGGLEHYTQSTVCNC